MNGTNLFEGKGDCCGDTGVHAKEHDDASAGKGGAAYGGDAENSDSVCREQNNRQ